MADQPAALASGTATPARRRRSSPWLRQSSNRLMLGLLTLVCVSIVLFAATQALPGSAARYMLGSGASPEAIAELEHELGLDRPVWVQYLDWAGGFLTGDMGTSLTSARTPVAQLVGPATSYSMLLLTLSISLAVVLSIVVGVLAAARRNGIFDTLFQGFSMVFTAIPEFVVGIGLVILFATTVFHIFPAVALIPPGSPALQNLDLFVLPVLTLLVGAVAYLGRLVRASMIEALDSEYILVARFKGLSEGHILFRHALPNSLVPMIQGTAVAIAYLSAGIVVVEYVFALPGLGTLLIQSVANRDLPLLQAVGLILAGVCVLANLIADMLVIYVTPKLRTRGGHQ